MADQPRGFCWGCGYDLRATGAGRCPECGRTFDTKDPRTMDMGRRPMGLWGRRLLTPLGWPPVLAATVATLALLAISSRPAAWRFSLAEPQYMLEWPGHGWRAVADRWHDLPDWVYGLSLLLWLTVLAYVAARLALRGAVILRHRPPKAQAGRTWRAATLVLALAIISFLVLGFAWPYRLARHWTAETLRRPDPAAALKAHVAYEPPQLAGPFTDAERMLILRTAVLQLPTTRQRLAGVNLLVCHAPDRAPPILREQLARERELRPWLIYLLALYRRPEDVSLFQACMKDPDPAMRAAGIDALGVASGPNNTWRVLLPVGEEFGPVLASDPPVSLSRVSQERYAWRPPEEVMEQALGKGLREELHRLAHEAPTEGERLAAARALLGWPPGQYELRVAEWGVWIEDGGDLKLVQSVLDETPPFVHRTGDRFDALVAERSAPIVLRPVTKPIVHVTANQPMVVDVGVTINSGRPWYAYPMPDDYVFGAWEPNYLFATPVGGPLAVLDMPGRPVLPGARLGYPWLWPAHEVHEGLGLAGSAVGLGLRWQSVLVTPQKAAWMKFPTVPKDPKYQWWEALRQVPSSYVTSRGETERFLYYDGPTLAKPPLTLGLEATGLHFSTPPAAPATAPAWTSQLFPRRDAERKGLIIQVRGGRALAALLVPPDEDKLLAVPALKGDAAGQLRALLLEAGLTEAEAQGLLAAWEGQFFKTDGMRYLLVLSRADYDRLCPMQITPEPNSTARVGLVLYELGTRR